MTLPTSGALTLDAIHVEAGGSSGTTASLNDSDIRGLNAGSGRTINSTLGTNIDFADFYGASVTAATDVTAAGTCGSDSTTTGTGKSAITTFYQGIGTTFATADIGSWSDQDYTTPTRGSFKIYDCFTSILVFTPQLMQIVVDSSAGQGLTWTAFTGFRYIRLNSATGTIIFDSDAVVSNSGQGQTSIFGTQSGASSGTNGTTWFHNVLSSTQIMPATGSVSLVLTN